MAAYMFYFYNVWKGLTTSIHPSKTGAPSNPTPHVVAETIPLGTWWVVEPWQLRVFSSLVQGLGEYGAGGNTCTLISVSTAKL